MADLDQQLQNARTRAENALHRAAGTAITDYLSEAESAVLDESAAAPNESLYPGPEQWASISRDALLEPLIEAYLGIWDAGLAVLDALTLPEGDVVAVLAAWELIRRQAAEQFAEDALARASGLPVQIEELVSAAIRRARQEGTGSGPELFAAAREALHGAYPDQQGDFRAVRIAQTEATAAAGAAIQQQGDTLAATLGFTGAAGDVGKRWVTRRDERVRESHEKVHGVVVGMTESFTVGGFAMRFPGDPSAPPDLTINCRCHLTLTRGRASQAGLTAGGTMSYRPTVSMRTDQPGTQPTTALAARARGAQEAGAASRVASGAPAALPDGWRGVLAPLDTLSGDGRMLKSAAGLRSRPYPLPFLAQEALSMGHDGAVNIGRTDRIWVEGGNLMGEGPFDLADAEGAAWARRIADGFAGGVSVDLDDVIFTEHFFDRDTGEEMDPEDAMELMWFSDDPGKIEYQLHMDDWRLIGHTAVYQPAFYQAQIQPVFGYEISGDVVELPAERASAAKIAEAAATRRAAAASASAALLAAGVPAGPPEPPAAWFESPTLPGPTPITVDDDGRVYGHIALWNGCHTGSPDVCIAPPKTRNNYALFHTGETVTREGDRLAVGRMTVGGGHADPWAPVPGAIEHYDNTGAVVAIVRAYEDSHGIVVAGALHPAATKQQVADFLLSPPSGDWRRVGTNLELVAVLSVNTPGYPVTRPRAAASADRQVSLVASGVPPINKTVGGGFQVRLPNQPAAAAVTLSATLARSLRRGRIEQIAAGLATRQGDPWAATRRTLRELEEKGELGDTAHHLALATARRHGFPG